MKKGEVTDGNQIDERPLVTFALFVYNQERLVAEAMAAAFAQEYSPLEIIVSDDCSSDGTWDVVEAMAAKYRGPHEIRIMRNYSNLGIGPHVSKVGLEARGKLIVVAAGDDISASNRVSRLVDAWYRNGCPECALHSAVLVKHGDGRNYVSTGAGSKPERATMEYFLENNFKGLFFGAAAAYTQNVFRKFPPLEAAFEDVALTFRALLIGQVLSVDDVLVDYNYSDSSVTRPLRIWERRRVERWFANLYQNVVGMEKDYAHFLRVSGLEADERILAKLAYIKHKRLRARGLATNNPLRFMLGVLCYPYGVSIRARLGFYRTFLGLRW